ncbi:MAG: hypothetical protein OXQ31_26090 [Spirochaetaceae bacterium]|nr:hypothetical protein [Spirochaetaceae bacterium]
MVGPNGEKRPGDPIANAVHIAKIATGEIEETYVHDGKHPGRRAAGQKGGAARAESLTPERRREIAMMGVEARLNGSK